MAKSHAFHGSPIEHGSHQGARLRDERDVAALCHGLREARIEVQIRHLDAKAVRADDAQQIGPRRFAHPLGQVSGNAGRYDHGGAAALAAKFGDDTRDRMWRGGHHAELRHEGQALAGRVALPAQNAGALGIYEADLALEVRPQQVLGDMQADRAGPFARADQRNALGLKYEIEIPDGHGNAPGKAPLHGTRR